MDARASRRMLGMAMIVVIGSTGCVTRGSYQELEAERDQLSSRLDAVERANAETQDELAALRLRSAEIEEALREEVVAQQIRVDEFRDGVRVDISNQMLFASGSAILSDDGRDVLGRLAKQLRGGSETISVEGHTDNLMIGKSLEKQYPSNWELAAARSARVVRRLSAEGVEPDRLRVVSLGPFSPAASNDTEEGRSRNRRTEILLRPAVE